MKFKDIKVGDKVLIPVSERGLSLFSPRKDFYIEQEVTRTTRTQFTAGGKRFRKDLGYEVGGSGRCLPIGEGGKQDQTQLRIAYRKRVNLILRAKYALQDAKLSNWTNDSLKELLGLLEENKGEES